MANAFLEIVCPLFGNTLAVIMLLSPIFAVLQIRRSGSLGTINPLPYPLTALNCFGWIVYGYLLKNPWVSPANIVGLVAGLFFTTQALPCADKKMQDTMSGILVAACAYFGILGIAGTFGMTHDQHTQAWGIQCMVILLLYYAIPLSSMWQVIRTRDAGSIYLPLACAAIANGTMWGLYGFFGVQDYNLGVTNTIGALLGFLQVGLRLYYGTKPLSAQPISMSDAGLESGNMAVAERQGSESGVQLLQQQAGSKSSNLGSGLSNGTSEASNVWGMTRTDARL